MDYIRSRFFLLEFLISLVTGTIVCLVAVVIVQPHQIAPFVALGPMLGFLMIGVGRWAFGGMWQGSGWFWRLIYSFASWGLLPGSVLLTDLHAKFIVARFYTGDKLIPYLMLDEFQ